MRNVTKLTVFSWVSHECFVVPTNKTILVVLILFNIYPVVVSFAAVTDSNDKAYLDHRPESNNLSKWYVNSVVLRNHLFVM